MDEPSLNLDAKLRAEKTSTQIVKLQRQLGTTTIYATTKLKPRRLSDRIVIMDQGQIQYCSTELYNHQPTSSLLNLMVTADELSQSIKAPLQIHHPSSVSVPRGLNFILQQYNVTFGYPSRTFNR